MKDTVIKGDGTSRLIKAPNTMPTSYSAWRTQLLAGSATLDISLNEAGCDEVGTPLNKESLLSEEAAGGMGLPADSTLNEALLALGFIEGEEIIDGVKWHYTKRNNGWLELWGSKDITDCPCTDPSSVGSMFKTATFTLSDYPISFAETPDIVAGFVATKSVTGGYYYPTIPYVVGNRTAAELKNTAPQLILLRPVAGNNVTGRITLHISGRWRSAT